MLSVAAQPKRRARVTERSFELAFAKALDRCGLASWHMNCREAGWPDRYVSGGIWIEFKVLETLGTVNQTEAEQRAKLRSLEVAGDRTFYCARYQDTVICAPWCDIAGKNLKDVERFHYKNGRDLDEIVRAVIKREVNHA